MNVCDLVGLDLVFKRCLGCYRSRIGGEQLLLVSLEILQGPMDRADYGTRGDGGPSELIELATILLDGPA